MSHLVPVESGVGMEMKSNQQSRPENWRPLALMLVVAAALLTIAFRLIPYSDRPINFAPAGAMFLFAGACLRPRWMMAVAAVAVVAVDGYFYAVKGWEVPWFSYASYCVYLMIGYFALGRTESPLKIGFFTVAASVQFFLVSNFGVWLAHAIRPEDYVAFGHTYPANLSGLLECYEAGIPFFRGTFLSDVIFSAVLFGAYAVGVRAFFPAERLVAVEEARS